MTDFVLVPIPRKLYQDIVRLTDGAIDPAEMATTQLEAWVVRDLESGDTPIWGDRLEEAAELYAPHLITQWKGEPIEAQEDRKPLVWKDVTIAAKSEVRMTYGGTQHYAKVVRGAIHDPDGKSYSPSEWASKVAGGTSRNAWRDLWFREPSSKSWVPATLLRAQAKDITSPEDDR